MSATAERGDGSGTDRRPFPLPPGSVIYRIGPVDDPAAFDPAELIAFLEPRMPRYMVPRYVQVVEDLPRTEASLRVRKHELRDRGVTDDTWDREARSPTGLTHQG